MVSDEVAQEFDELNENENSSIYGGSGKKSRRDGNRGKYRRGRNRAKSRDTTNLIDSEVTITNQNSRGKGKHTVSYSHEFASRADLFKLIIFRHGVIVMILALKFILDT